MYNKQKPITEAISFGDIVNAIASNGMSLIDRIRNTNRSYGGKNIAKATSDLILTFPVIADESVPIKSATMITKAIERKAVTMLQILFTAISTTNNKDAFDFIHKIHTNISTDDIDDIFASMVEETNVDIDQKIIKLINEANIAIDREPQLRKEFKVSLNNIYTITPSYNDYIISEASGSKNNNTQKNDKKVEILSGEIKKANEIQPTMMVVKFKGPDKDDIIYSAVIGVKARLQYVTTEDMIDRLVEKNKDRHGLFDLIRAATKEISFLKDFIFAVDKAKLDAIKKGKKTSPIWKVLERRALKFKYGRLIGNNDASAISTLLISKETADTLNKEYELDVFKPKDILEIMDAYNIMAFFVDDNINEVIYYLYDDNSRVFERLSYTALKKDNNSELKSVITLLAKNK